MKNQLEQNWLKYLKEYLKTTANANLTHTIFLYEYLAPHASQTGFDKISVVIVEENLDLLTYHAYERRIKVETLLND